MTREEQDRLTRLQSLATNNVNAYPDNAGRTHLVADALASFESLEKSEETIVVCGRAMAIRDIGALSFLKLQDDSGVMQVVLRKADLEADYSFFLSHADVGDILEAKGRAYVTKTGEKSVLVTSIRILSKALKPLPEKWHGLSDVETRYRERELDLIVNPAVRERFRIRSKIVSGMRAFLDTRGFLEVETPMLQPIPGGANARPFVTHHNALGADLFLRIAPELYLKRLVVGGFEKIYEIGRCFRNEGIDYSHNPEFTMLELYWAYVNKDAFISFMEELLVTVIAESLGTLKVTTSEEGRSIDFTGPWPRKTFREAILEACGIDIDELATVADVKAAVKAKKVKVDFAKCVGLGEHLDELWKKTARPKITNPVWIFDYPVDLKPLAKTHPVDKTKSSTVQLVIEGAEVINAYYHELNDPIDQRARFVAQETLREQGSEEAQHLDEAFLSALEHAMPPTSGFGIGIDRFIAFLTGVPNLKEVILFPTLKPDTGQRKPE